uniref:Uncharacterized protein n=1 Tax=Meloidogyne javanica TaxID=6303 RepID=A0A915N4P0_MELJA
MENDDDSKHKNTLEYLVGPYATHKTLTTQHQFPSSHDEFSLQPYASHQTSTHPHQFPSPSLLHQQFIPNVQNPFSQHVENHSINPSPIQQSFEYSNMDLDYLNYNQQMNNNYSTDGNTLEGKNFRTAEVNDILFIESFCLNFNPYLPQIDQEIVKLQNNFVDYWHFIKTRQYKCYNYHQQEERVNVNYYKCAEKNKQKCNITFHHRNYFDITLKKEHTCFKPIPNTLQATICVIPKKENNNSTYKYFVGSQSVGEECKEYSIPENLNIFIVSWVENVNIEFDKPDETKEKKE